MSIAYINDQYVPLEKATISVMDRGFLFGDGVYEVIPVFNGKLFRINEHLTRLETSLKKIKLFLNKDHTFWLNIFNELISSCEKANELSIYVQVTRGFAPIRMHEFPEEVNPTIFAFCTPIKTLPINILAQGIHAITLKDIRWQRCDIKAVTLLANVLGKQAAKEQNAKEAILIRDGFAVEGTSSNIFMIKNNNIITPPLDDSILGGITRNLILELAQKYQLPFLQRKITQDELYNADELWLTSSTKEIMPIIKLDNAIIGEGVAGTLWQEMIKYYQSYKQEL